MWLPRLGYGPTVMGLSVMWLSCLVALSNVALSNMACFVVQPFACRRFSVMWLPMGPRHCFLEATCILQLTDDRTSSFDHGFALMGCPRLW